MTPHPPSRLAGYLVEILNTSMKFPVNPIHVKDIKLIKILVWGAI
jgi:hypothetical protein